VARKRVVSVAVSLLVTLILVAVLMSGIKFRDLAETLRRIYLPALFAFVAVSLLSAWLRAWRYKWLLGPGAISWGEMFLATFIRNSFEDLLPARIGSLSYIVVLTKRLSIPFESATSTFVVAFILDFLTLSPFLAGALFGIGFSLAGLPTGTLMLAAAVYFLIVCLLLWKIVPVTRFLVRFYRALLAAIGAEHKPKALASVEKLQETVEQLRDIQSRKIFGRLFVLSLFIRLGKYLSLYVLLFAILHSRGFGFKSLSFSKTILGVTGAELTSVLPVKGLADFGTWESAWTVAFGLMGFDRQIAILSGIGIHLITNLWEYALGILSIVILALPRKNGVKRTFKGEFR